MVPPSPSKSSPHHKKARNANAPASTPEQVPARSASPATNARRRLAILLSLAVVAIAAALWYSWVARQQVVRSHLLADVRRDRPNAVAQLATYLVQHPRDDEACEALVEWHLRAQSPLSDFETHLNHLCELRPTDPDPLRTRAVLRARDGRPEEAVSDGLKALELSPDDTTTRRIVATAAADAGQHDVAIRESQTLVDQTKGERPEFAVMLIKAYLQANDVAGAERAFAAHFPASRDNADRQAIEAQILQAGKKHVEAVNVLQTLARQSDQYREFALTRLAQSYAALGRDREAGQALDQLEAIKQRARLVIDANQRPDNLDAQLKAGQVLVEDREYAKAIALLETACQRHGVAPPAAQWLATAYRGLGQTERAEEWERRAKLAPEGRR